MDTIEKGIIEIDEHTKNAINKHNELFSKTLYNSAQKSNKSSNNLDSNYKKIFTDLDTIGKLDENVFNPDTVVEFRDGKSYQVIESWDKIEGILPNRKVMGLYYVDQIINVNDNGIIYCSKHNKDVTLKCNNCNREGTMSCNHNPSNYGLSCGCNYYNNYNTIYRFGNLDCINKLYNREEVREIVINTQQTKTFEVDNYLNLYHKESGLYLMFHKTSFPEICFYLAREYTQLPNKNNYYQIYLSKRLKNITVNFDKNHYHSKDNRETFLNSLNELIPDTYQRIFTLYNNFRKMQSFNIDTEQENILSDTNKEINILDTKDRIINGLRERLNQTILRCEKSESIISEMVEQYNKKSNDILNLERENSLLELKIEEIKKDIKNQYFEKLEQKDKDTFELYKRLSEAEVFKSKCESLDISIETMKKNLERETLEKKKFKDMNLGLINQIRQEKERNTKIKNDNEELLEQLKYNKTSLEDNEIKMNKLNKDLTEKRDECCLLVKQIEKIGENSDNALENALSDRVNDLEKQLEKLIEENRELHKDNERNIKKNREIMNTLSILTKTM